jgi:hypothetical protein
MFLEKAGVIGDPERRIGGRQRGEGNFQALRGARSCGVKKPQNEQDDFQLQPQHASHLNV